MDGPSWFESPSGRREHMLNRSYPSKIQTGMASETPGGLGQSWARRFMQVSRTKYSCLSLFPHTHGRGIRIPIANNMKNRDDEFRRRSGHLRAMSNADPRSTLSRMSPSNRPKRPGTARGHHFNQRSFLVTPNCALYCLEPSFSFNVRSDGTENGLLHAPKHLAAVGTACALPSWRR
jgi:hypothetical protein